MVTMCVVGMVLCMIAFAGWYAYLLKRKRITPALATWLLFFAGTLLSLVSYILAARWSITASVLNALDVVSVGVVAICILCWRERSLHFSRFDRWFLTSMALIILYGVITGDAWNANYMAQALITSGYVPTVGKLLRKKRNEDTYVGWILGGLASAFGIYPALVVGNRLSLVYAVRGTVCVVFLLGLMWYYDQQKQIQGGKRVQ